MDYQKNETINNYLRLENQYVEKEKDKSVAVKQYDHVKQPDIEKNSNYFINEKDFEELNQKFLEELKYRINKNKTIDVLNIIDDYEFYAARTYGCLCEKSVSKIEKNKDSFMKKKKKLKKLNKYYDVDNTDNTEYYCAIKKIFSTNTNCEDIDNTLEALLKTGIENIGDQNNTQFKYIKLEDVFKSKGNCINGPRREDIGRYNIKLFEMQCKKNNKTINVDINPLFFEELECIANKYEIIRCEHIKLFYFKNRLKYEIDNFFIVVFLKAKILNLTIRNSDITLFDFTEEDDFKADMSDNSKEIIFFYNSNFILYKIEFSSVEKAKDIYEIFFQKIKKF